MQNIITGAIVTVARTVIGTLLALVANALLAYIISRKEFLFKSQLSLFWVITMYVNGGLIPVLLLYKTLGLTNSFWVYVIPGMVSAFNVLVLRTYMQGLPEALEDAAKIDGAGYMTIFVKVISPLCKPVYATVALFVAVGQWNSWFDAMIYNRMKTEYTTLQYELMKLLSSVMQQSGSATSVNAANVSTVTPVTVRSAATVITMLPIICLYPFLQRYFVAGLTIGGVKWNNKDRKDYSGWNLLRKVPLQPENTETYFRNMDINKKRLKIGKMKSFKPFSTERRKNVCIIRWSRIWDI